MKCPDCGNMVEEGAKFCSHCGSAVHKGRDLPGSRKRFPIFKIIVICLIIFMAAGSGAVLVPKVVQMLLQEKADKEEGESREIGFTEEAREEESSQDTTADTAEAVEPEGIPMPDSTAAISADLLAGMWTVDMELTSENNVMSMRGTFGSGLEYGYEMVFDENGKVLWHFMDCWGGEGTFDSKEGKAILQYRDKASGEDKNLSLTAVEKLGEIYLVMDTAEFSDSIQYELYWKKCGKKDSEMISDGGLPAETTEAFYKSREVQGNSQYIFPDSDRRYLSESDLEGLTPEECRLARNELYARHGRMFEDEQMRAYFNSCEWYEPSIPAKDFSDSLLNAYETANRDLIVRYEKEHGYNR